MNLPITSWSKTLRTLGYKVRRNISSKHHRRAIDSEDLRYGPLEPRQMMAGDTGIVVQADLDQLLATTDNPLVARLGQFDNNPSQDAAILSADGRLTIATNGDDNSFQSQQTVDLGIGAAHGLELGLINDDLFTDLIIQGSDSLSFQTAALTLAYAGATRHDDADGPVFVVVADFLACVVRDLCACPVGTQRSLMISANRSTQIWRLMPTNIALPSTAALRL